MVFKSSHKQNFLFWKKKFSEILLIELSLSSWQLQNLLNSTKTLPRSLTRRKVWNPPYPAHLPRMSAATIASIYGPWSSMLRLDFSISGFLWPSSIPSRVILKLKSSLTLRNHRLPSSLRFRPLAVLLEQLLPPESPKSLVVEICSLLVI